ncbi:MAG: ABC transporter ATP-binding protein [Promethearchaeota archaeon]
MTIDSTKSGELMVGFVIDKLDRTGNQTLQSELHTALINLEKGRMEIFLDKYVYRLLSLPFRLATFTYRNLIRKPIKSAYIFITKIRNKKKPQIDNKQEKTALTVGEFNTFIIGNSQCDYANFDAPPKRIRAEEIIRNKYQKYLKRTTKRFQTRIKRNKSELQAHKTLAKFLKTIPGCPPDPEGKIREENRKMTNYIEDSIARIINQSEIIYWSFNQTGKESIVVHDGVYHRQFSPEMTPSAVHAFDELLILNFARPFLKSLYKLIQDISKRVKQAVDSLDGSTETTINNPRLASEAFRILVGDLVGGIDAFRTMIRQVTRIQEVHLAAKDELELLSEFGGELKVEFNHIEQYTQLISDLQEDITILKMLQKKFQQLERDSQQSRIRINPQGFHRAIIELTIQLREAKIWSDRFNDIAYLTPESGGVALESGQVDITYIHEKDTIVEAVRLYKTYRPTQNTVYALRGANLKIKRGEFVAVLGPSGTGKTTLINCMAGLDIPDRGKTYLQGRDISLMDDNELSEFRRKSIGFVFQQYVLDPRLTVYENIVLPARLSGNTRNLDQRANDILESVGLTEYATQIPTKLSGGQMQRVIIARACINDPLVIFADEPTGDLDSETGKQVMSNFRKLCDDKGIAIVLVTHDQEMADFADRTVRMKDGSVFV